MANDALTKSASALSSPPEEDLFNPANASAVMARYSARSPELASSKMVYDQSQQQLADSRKQKLYAEEDQADAQRGQTLHGLAGLQPLIKDEAGEDIPNPEYPGQVAKALETMPKHLPEDPGVRAMLSHTDTIHKEAVATQHQKRALDAAAAKVNFGHTSRAVDYYLKAGGTPEDVEKLPKLANGEPDPVAIMAAAGELKSGVTQAKQDAKDKKELDAKLQSHDTSTLADLRRIKGISSIGHKNMIKEDDGGFFDERADKSLDEVKKAGIPIEEADILNYQGTPDKFAQAQAKPFAEFEIKPATWHWNGTIETEAEMADAGSLSTAEVNALKPKQAAAYKAAKAKAAEAYEMAFNAFQAVTERDLRDQYVDRRRLIDPSYTGSSKKAKTKEPAEVPAAPAAAAPAAPAAKVGWKEFLDKK